MRTSRGRTRERSNSWTALALLAAASIASLAMAVVLTACASSSAPGAAASPSATAAPVAGNGEQMLVWRFTTGAPVRSAPAVADGVVYVGNDDGRLFAVDAASGRQRWAFASGGEITCRPAIGAGAVYVRSADGYLYALDRDSGEVRWKLKTGGPAASSPAASGESVFIGTSRGEGPDDGFLYALYGRDGALRWKVKTGGDVWRNDASPAAPAASNGVVYYGVGSLEGFDAATGRKVWHYNPGAIFNATAVIASGMVYFRCTGFINGIYALQTEHPYSDDATKWLFLAGDSRTSPAVAGGIVYCLGKTLGRRDRDPWANQGPLHAIDALNGRELWSRPVGDVSGSCSPAAADGLVVVGSEDGWLTALDARTGASQWRFRTKEPIHSTPAISDGVVYVGCDDGCLYAVGPKPAVTYAESPEPGVYRHKIGGTGTVGWSFAPTVDIGVTHLGCFSPEPVGLEEAHRVGIFDAKSERLLDSVTVRDQSPLEGFFRWEPLRRPLVLEGGHTYLIGTGTLGDETLYEEGLPSEQWAAEVVFGELLTSYGRSGGRFMAPTDPTQGANWDKIVWMSPNFKFIAESGGPAAH